jgi:hypothetical protein
MAKSPHITRRAAVVGLGATVTGLVTAEEVVASVQRTGAVSVVDQLNELAVKFSEAAKLIDPTIRGSWTGHDVYEGRLFQIYLEREHSPFARKAG